MGSDSQMIGPLERRLRATETKLRAAEARIAELQGELDRVRQQPCFYCCRAQPLPLLTPLEPMSDTEADRILADAGFTEEELQQKEQAFAEQVVTAIDAHPAPSAPALRDRLEATRAWYAERSDNTFHGDDVERDLAALLDDRVADVSAPAEQSNPVCPDCGVAKRDDALRAAEQSAPGEPKP